MANKRPRRRRSFTPEFKAEVVALVRQTGRSVGAVARENASGLDGVPLPYAVGLGDEE